MQKYFKIGEIAKLYNIGVDSIRYLEEIGLIKPERSKAGYRLYSIYDIWRLNVIRDLRSIGFSMEQIRKYLTDHTISSSIDMLIDEKKAILNQMEYLNNIKKNIEKRLNNIDEALNIELNEIKIIQMPTRKCHRLAEGYNKEAEMDLLMMELINLNKGHLYIIGSNQIGTVISLNELKNNHKISYQSVFIIDEDGPDTIESGSYLSISYRGNYQNSAYYSKQLIEYAKLHNLEISGDILEILLIDIHTTSNENEYLTELQLPIKQ